MRHTDVAIVGAGLAGTVAGAMLARDGVDFVAVDPDAVYPWDFRCEKLDPSQIALLEKAGLAEMALESVTPADAIWTVRLGRFVQRRHTRQFGFYYDKLVNRLRAEIPADRFIQGKVASVAASPDRQALVLSGGQEISARLVILATGPNNALRKSLGFDREILSSCHSITIGFDMKPLGRDAFDFPAMTFFPDRPEDSTAYLTLFPVGSVLRANLFVYRDFRDPWLGAFRNAPKETLLALLPGVRPLLGAFEITGQINIRPVDLYQTSGHRRSGVVLVGDAFATSCPAAGTGANKVLTDVERLCNVYLPRWLAGKGMGAEKIGAFYDDLVKQRCDAASLASALHMRSLSTDRALRWRFLRLMKHVRGHGRHILDTARGKLDPRSWQSATSKPEQATNG